MNSKIKVKKKNYKKKAFTLIELLAVIIILGILLIIAVPAVTKYINDSRKNGYVSTAKSIAGGVRNLVNSGEYDMYDKDITYYVEGSCVATDNGYKSPYGEFVKSYVAVTTSNNENNYYWISVDSTGTGVKTLINVDDLESDNIEGNVLVTDVNPTIGIDGRSKVVVIGGENCTKSNPTPAEQMLNIKTGKIKNACPQVTETIYWALQNPNGSNYYQKLVISDSPVTGGESGNFPGNSDFSESNAPWIISWDALSYVSQIEIVGSVAPRSISSWFNYLGKELSSFDIDLSNLEVCNVTNMRGLFQYSAENATTVNLNLSNWDASKVEDMHSMFYSFGVNASTFNLNLSGFDTSNVRNMSSMFETAGSIASNWSVLGLKDFDVSNVTDMSLMFKYVGRNVENFSLNLSGWNTKNVTDMHDMFSYSGDSSTGYSLNLSGWNTSKVENMRSMFYQAGWVATTWSVTGVDSWNTSNVTNMSRMFNTALSAENLYLDIGSWNMSNVENISYMFSYFGNNSSNVSIIIPQTNGARINNTTTKIYGKNTETYYLIPMGMSFTLAN